MKKSLVSLGIAAALMVPAGAAYAQTDATDTVDDTTTCRMVDGAGAQTGYGFQNGRTDGAPYGDPELCQANDDPVQTRSRAQSHDRAQVASENVGALGGDGNQYRGQGRAMAGGGVGDPDSCPFGGAGPLGLGNGAGSTVS